MANDDTLLTLRAAIDVCNHRIVAVLHERAALVREVAAWKRAHGIPVADPAREAAMLEDIGRLAAAEGFDAAALQRIFAVVFAESRALGER